MISRRATNAMLDHVIDNYGAEIPLADLFYYNLNKTLGKDLLSAEYVGLRTVDGVPCHQLSFESPGADWQIWIEADSTPVPRRFVIDFVDDDNKPEYMARMDAWSVGGEIEDYNFVAAEGAAPSKKSRGSERGSAQGQVLRLSRRSARPTSDLTDPSQDCDGPPAVGSVQIAASVTPGHPH